MFESFEVRRVANGFVLIIHDLDGEIKEYVYDTARKLMRVLKQHLAVRDGEAD
jgi:hypothetical protein